MFSSWIYRCFIDSELKLDIVDIANDMQCDRETIYEMAK